MVLAAALDEVPVERVLWRLVLGERGEPADGGLIGDWGEAGDSIMVLTRASVASILQASPGTISGKVYSSPPSPLSESRPAIDEERRTGQRELSTSDWRGK